MNLRILKNNKNTNDGMKSPPTNYLALLDAALEGHAQASVLNMLAVLVSRYREYEFNDSHFREGHVLYLSSTIVDPAWFDALMEVFNEVKSDLQNIQSQEEASRLRYYDTLQAISRYAKANPSDSRAVTFLIDQIACQSKNFDKATLIDCLRGVPKLQDVDISPLVKLTQSKSWELRMAIRSLDKVTSDQYDMQQVVLDVIAAFPKNHDTLSDALYTLREYATVKSLPYLKPLLRHSSYEVSSGARYVWAQIRKSEDTDMYCNLLLESKGWLSKYHTTTIIATYGDERAIPTIIDRVRAALARKRKTEFGAHSEMIVAFKYLANYRSSHSAVDQLFDWVKNRPEGYIQQSEKEWLRHNIV